MGKVNDLTGKRFGRLVVVARAGTNERRYATWLCRCDCGNTTVVGGGELRSGNTRSCGCLHDDLSRIRHTSHGMSKTKLYYVWNSMIGRCCNPNNKAFMNYGGRGITVCEDWRDFEPFRDWALENGYQDGLTIDRKDNDGPYSPNNCRWVTRKSQNNNKRNNHLIEFGGVSHTMAEWAELLGITYNALEHRIARGEPIAKALTTPPFRK